MTRETTRRVNKKVVESLEAAAHMAQEAIFFWAIARLRVEETANYTRAHDDLLEEIDTETKHLAQVQESIRRHLEAERDGQGR